MKLSKKQKLEAYTYALICALFVCDYKSDNEYMECDSYVYHNVCSNLEDWLEEIGHSEWNILTRFPEFNMQRPKNKSTDEEWWTYPWKSIKSHNKRIAAIERAIQLTEQL